MNRNAIERAIVLCVAAAIAVVLVALGNAADALGGGDVLAISWAGGIKAAGTLALVLTGMVHVWMVYSLSFLMGCVTAVDMPTLMMRSFSLPL